MHPYPFEAGMCEDAGMHGARIAIEDNVGDVEVITSSENFAGQSSMQPV